MTILMLMALRTGKGPSLPNTNAIRQHSKALAGLASREASSFQQRGATVSIEIVRDSTQTSHIRVENPGPLQPTVPEGGLHSTLQSRSAQTPESQHCARLNTLTNTTADRTAGLVGALGLDRLS